MEDHVEDGAVRRQLDPEEDEPAAQVAATVADIRGTDVTELSDMYGCADSVLDSLFSDPPDDDARMDVSFDYEGFRVTVEQDGTVRFRERA
ncbi:HalOD1 output domain-containing protein [Halosimplex marinum]|uniref:HalOD1 output domain-containing protein n=1 Tax=Halosimplex marinum TaxID=3396620 RepID=UPI003F557743